MSNVTEGIQLQTLVRFLRVALRNDATLLSTLGTTAEYVCHSGLEIEPVGVENKELVLYVTDFPTITAREISSVPKYVGPYHGVRSLVRLWYVVQPFLGDTTESYELVVDGEEAGMSNVDIPVPDKAVTDRWLRNVFWRTMYWLRVHEVEATSEEGGTTTWDLHDAGQIYRLQLPTQVRYRHVGPVSLWEADLQMEYYLPPYAVSAPSEAEQIDFILGTEASEGTPGTPYVESETELETS